MGNAPIRDPQPARGPRPLTKAQIEARAKRKKIYDLRRENASWEDIGKAMGLEPQTCEKYFRQAMKRGEFEAFESADSHGKVHRVEVREPEAAAAIIAGLAASSFLDPDPKYRALKEAAAAAGWRPTLVNALIKRLRVGDYTPAREEVKSLVGKDLVECLDKKIAMTLGYIDDYSMASASFKDLNIGLSIMVEKSQLLKSQPTHIIDFTTRTQVNGLLPVLIAEAKRRGFTIDGSAKRVDAPGGELP